MEAAVARAAQSANVPTPTVDTSTTNEHMPALQANLQCQQEGIQAAAEAMIRENRQAFARMAAQQGLTANEMAKAVERAIANEQPVHVDKRSVAIDARPLAIDARSVNVGVDARSMNVDARTVNQTVDARSGTVQKIADNRTVANVVNVQGGPPPPPASAGAVAVGTKRKQTFPYPFSKAAPPMPALTDHLAITAGPPLAPPQPPVPEAPAVVRAKSAPRGRVLAIEDRPPRTRTRSVRPTAEEKAAMAAARAAARQAREDEKTRRYLDREEEPPDRARRLGI
jgi:hypothetical protein